MKKRALVAGAAGFIGSHLCDSLLEKGYEVIAVDNLITGSLRNLDHLFHLSAFTFYHHDITHFLYVKGPLTHILHFASPASPIDYLKIPIQTLKAGSIGTYNLLGLAKEKGARILVASTSEIYGEPLVHPQPEDYFGNVDTLGPRGVYDEAKRFMESMTMAYNRFHGVDTRIVRIFNTYGPRMRLNDGRVIPNFMAQALKKEGFSIYGNGQQTRSFCYVDDLVEGILGVLISDHTYPVNLGNPEEISIRTLAEEIAALAGTECKMVDHPLPQGDPSRRKPDISKAIKLLGWRPSTPRSQGLAKTMDYFRKQLNGQLLSTAPRDFSMFNKR